VIPEPVSQAIQAPTNEAESEPQVKCLSWKMNLSRLPACRQPVLEANYFAGFARASWNAGMKGPQESSNYEWSTGEGKTFIATNLALTLAGRDDSRVLLIDGDLRKRQCTRY